MQANASCVAEAELVRYRKQHAAVVAVVAQYEADPSDFRALVELIQEMQTHGDPPKEIVEDVAGGARAAANLMDGFDGLDFSGSGGGGAADAGAAGGGLSPDDLINQKCTVQ